jgi:beta-mannanase
MVNWEPTDGGADCTKWANSNIIRGDYDSYITQWAIDAKSFGGTVILRFAHELNGSWFVWGNGRCTNTPTTLKAMWKHVWQIFHNVGATNVKFLWSIGGGTRNTKNIYPGDAYVDYVGSSPFNWGPPTAKWKTMLSVFTAGVTALSRMSKRPIIAAETGTANVPNCAKCNNAAYIQTGYAAVYKKFPRVVAIVYFDIDMRFANQPDWRLDTSSAALSAYQGVVADKRFQGKIP